jgi:hypothetical protein
MRYLVQIENFAFCAVILGQCAGGASSLRTFCGREAGLPVTALREPGEYEHMLIFGLTTYKKQTCRIHEFPCIKPFLQVPDCLYDGTC